jgi:hypothetical protein
VFFSLVIAININQAILGLVCTFSITIALPLATLRNKKNRPIAK